MQRSDAIARLEALFAARTGIDLGRGLKGLALERFVAARALELGHRSVDEYVDALGGAGELELDRLVNAATVGLTWFFRDPDQLAAVARLFGDRARTLDIWVAGCATGEDVYSLAMLAAGAGQPVRILGSDINSEFVAHAVDGVYSAWACRNVPAEHLRHLLPAGEGRRTVAPALRRDVRFVRHNLIDPPPPAPSSSGWDLVLCRNVLIYFYPQQATQTVARLAGALAPDGWLVLGANEMAQCESPLVELVPLGGRHALQRASGGAPRPAGAAVGSRPAALPPAFAALPPAFAALPPAPAVAAPAAAPAPIVPEPAELLQRANERHAAAQFADALQLYAQVLAADPLSVEARMFLGIVHYKIGDFSAAAVALRAAIYLEPHLWPAAFYLALSYDKLGQHEAAAREYRRVVASAGRRLPLSGGAMAQLEAWKEEVVHLARDRATAALRTDARRR